MNIIILNSSANKKSIGCTPSFENIKNFSTNFVTIYFVDYEFNYVLLNSKHQHQNYKTEFINLQKIENLKNVDDQYFCYFIAEHYHSWDKNIDFSIPTLYINCTDIQNSSSYDIMLLVENFNLSNFHFFNFYKDENSKIDLIKIYKDYSNWQLSPYDLFSTNKIIDIKENDFLFLKKHFDCGISLIINYLESGFNDFTATNIIPQKHIPNWCYNVEIPILKGIILYYGIKSPISDITQQISMIESNEFRFTLLNFLIRFFSNFLVNNNILKGNYDWFDIKTWETAKTKFNKFNV